MLDSVLAGLDLQSESALAKSLGAIIALFASAAMILFVVLAVVRVSYPFELEWIEGASVDGARWILMGNSLYGEPNIEFVPMVYNPLFFFLSAGLMKLFGVGFLAPRLISTLSTLGCFLLIGLIVTKESRHPLAGLAAAGVYAASFRFAGAWMDIAKPDSLFLLLILSAFFLGRQIPGVLGMVTSGLIYTAAFYTKQTALPVIAFMAPLSLLMSRGRSWPKWLSAVIVGGAVFCGMDRASDGWFSFYTFDMVLYHKRVSGLWSFWCSLVQKMWPSLLTVFLGFLLLVRREGFTRRLLTRSWQVEGLSVALLLASWSVFLQRWTFSNGFMPACAGLAILVGLSCSWVMEFKAESSEQLASGVAVIVLGLILVQFVGLSYNPFRQLPTDEMERNWRRFVRRLDSLKGEVLVLNHGFVNYFVDKSTYLHGAAYSDAAGGGSHPARTQENQQRREDVARVLQHAVTQQDFDWIVSGGSEERWLPYFLLSSEEPFTASPLTGPPAGTEFFFVENPVVNGGGLPLADEKYDFLFGRGWSAPADWGRWLRGDEAFVNVALEQGYRYSVYLEVFPYRDSGLSGRDLTVHWNDTQLGRYEFSACDPGTIAFELPPELITASEDQLMFRCEESFGQSSCSEDEEGPTLGFGSIRFVQVEE